MTRPLCGRVLARRLTLTALAVTLLSMAACGMNATYRTIPVGNVQPAAHPHWDAVCLDRTPSYPAEYFDAAKRKLADAVETFAAPGKGGATIAVRLIGHNTFDPESLVGVFQIPAVPPQPTRAQAASSSTQNPFDAAPTATAEAAQENAAYQAQQETERQALAQAQQQADATASVFRSLEPATDEPSDILGCVSSASTWLATAPADAEKKLVLVSDLWMQGDQQATQDRSLSGVSVLIFYWFTADAQSHDQRESWWNGEFQRDHASSVRFLDPAASSALDPSALL